MSEPAAVGRLRLAGEAVRRGELCRADTLPAALAALALVEQWEAHESEAKHCRMLTLGACCHTAMALTHEDAAAEMLVAIEKAVGE